MKFEFLYDNGRQRFYKASRPINVGQALVGKVDVGQEFKREIKRILRHRPELSFLNKCVADIVCISDGHTHSERLVFLGFSVPKKFQKDNADRPYCYLNVQIGGENTMMIHGGDARTMRNDEVYLRKLSIINRKKGAI